MKRILPYILKDFLLEICGEHSTFLIHEDDIAEAEYPEHIQLI